MDRSVHVQCIPVCNLGVGTVLYRSRFIFHVLYLSSHLIQISVSMWINVSYSTCNAKIKWTNRNQLYRWPRVCFLTLWVRRTVRSSFTSLIAPKLWPKQKRREGYFIVKSSSWRDLLQVLLLPWTFIALVYDANGMSDMWRASTCERMLSPLLPGHPKKHRASRSRAGLHPDTCTPQPAPDGRQPCGC